MSPVIEGAAVVRHSADPSAGDEAAVEVLRILGVDMLRDLPVREYRVEDRGSAPPVVTADDFLELLREPDAVVLTEKFALRHHVAVGDRLPVRIGDRDVSLVVRGLLRDEGPARVLDGNLAVMDIAAAQLALDRLGRIDRLDVRLHQPATIDRVEDELAARLPEALMVQRPERRGRQVEQMLSAFQQNLTALSYIALLVGAFLVYNTVSTSVIARRQENRHAAGARRLQARHRLRVPRRSRGAGGSRLRIGLLLGTWLSHGAVALTAATVNNLYVATAAAPPALTWTDAAVGFAIAVALAVVAGMLPAREASRVEPLSAIRGSDRVATAQPSLRFVLAAPLILLAVGGALTVQPAVAGVPIAGFGAALAFVLAGAFVVPFALTLLARAGGRPARRLFGVEGLLALGNLSAAIPRLSISVAALAVSLSMMVAIAIMVGSFRETVIYWVHQTLQADLYVGPGRGPGAAASALTPDVQDIVTSRPEVEHVDAFRRLSIVVGDRPAFLVSTDFDVLLARNNLLFKAPRHPTDAIRAARAQDAVLVTEAFAVRRGLRVDDDVALRTPAGLRPFRIAAIYYDYSSDRGVVAMDRRTFDRWFGPQRPTGLTVYLHPGSDPEHVRQAIANELGASRRVHMYTRQALRTEVLRIFDSTFAITYALEIVAIVVAILGIAATLLTLILERRREIAMLRLIGADRRQVRRMVVIEAAMLGGVSQAVGLIIGVVLSLVLIYVINLQSFGWTIQFDVPVLFLAQMSMIVLLATALSGVYPARRASQLHMAEQVTEE